MLEDVSKVKGKFGNPAHGHAANHAKRLAASEHGKSIKYPALYDHLRAKGYSKRKAAMISNGKWRKKHGKPPKSLPKSKGLVGANVPAAAVGRLRKSSPEGSELYVPSPYNSPKKKKKKRKDLVEDIQKDRSGTLRAARAAKSAQDWLEALHARDLDGKFKDMPNMPDRDKRLRVRGMPDRDLADLGRQIMNGEIADGDLEDQVRQEIKMRRGKNLVPKTGLKTEPKYARGPRPVNTNEVKNNDAVFADRAKPDRFDVQGGGKGEAGNLRAFDEFKDQRQKFSNERVDRGPDPYVDNRRGNTAEVKAKIAQADKENAVKNLDENNVPLAPGKAPLPPKTARAYHYTSVDNLGDIRSNGIRIDRARGDKYGEPKGIWLSGNNKEWGHPEELQGKVLIEIAVPEDVNVPHGGLEKTFALNQDVPPEWIVGIHEQWHNRYRDFEDNDLLDGVANGDYDHLANMSDYAEAIKRIKNADAPEKPKRKDPLNDSNRKIKTDGMREQQRNFNQKMAGLGANAKKKRDLDRENDKNYLAYDAKRDQKKGINDGNALKRVLAQGDAVGAKDKKKGDSWNAALDERQADEDKKKWAGPGKFKDGPETAELKAKKRRLEEARDRKILDLEQFGFPHDRPELLRLKEDKKNGRPARLEDGFAAPRDPNAGNVLDRIKRQKDLKAKKRRLDENVKKPSVNLETAVLEEKKRRLRADADEMSAEGADRLAAQNKQGAPAAFRQMADDISRKQRDPGADGVLTAHNKRQQSKQQLSIRPKKDGPNTARIKRQKAHLKENKDRDKRHKAIYERMVAGDFTGGDLNELRAGERPYDQGAKGIEDWQLYSMEKWELGRAEIWLRHHDNDGGQNEKDRQKILVELNDRYNQERKGSFKNATKDVDALRNEADDASLQANRAERDLPKLAGDNLTNRRFNLKEAKNVNREAAIDLRAQADDKERKHRPDRFKEGQKLKEARNVNREQLKAIDERDEARAGQQNKDYDRLKNKKVNYLKAVTDVKLKGLLQHAEAKDKQDLTPEERKENNLFLNRVQAALKVPMGNRYKGRDKNPERDWDALNADARKKLDAKKLDRNKKQDHIAQAMAGMDDKEFNNWVNQMDRAYMLENLDQIRAEQDRRDRLKDGKAGPATIAEKQIRELKADRNKRAGISPGLDQFVDGLKARNKEEQRWIADMHGMNDVEFVKWMEEEQWDIGRKDLVLAEKNRRFNEDKKGLRQPSLKDVLARLNQKEFNDWLINANSDYYADNLDIIVAEKERRGNPLDFKGNPLPDKDVNRLGDMGRGHKKGDTQGFIIAAMAGMNDKELGEWIQVLPHADLMDNLDLIRGEKERRRDQNKKRGPKRRGDYFEILAAFNNDPDHIKDFDRDDLARAQQEAMRRNLGDNFNENKQDFIRQADVVLRNRSPIREKQRGDLGFLTPKREPRKLKTKEGTELVRLRAELSEAKKQLAAGPDPRRNFQSQANRAIKEKRAVYRAEGWTARGALERKQDAEADLALGADVDRQRVPWKKVDPDRKLDAFNRKELRRRLGPQANNDAYMAAVEYKEFNGIAPTKLELAAYMRAKKAGVTPGPDKDRHKYLLGQKARDLDWAIGRRQRAVNRRQEELDKFERGPLQPAFNKVMAQNRRPIAGDSVQQKLVVYRELKDRRIENRRWDKDKLLDEIAELRAERANITNPNDLLKNDIREEAHLWRLERHNLPELLDVNQAIQNRIDEKQLKDAKKQIEQIKEEKTHKVFSLFRDADKNSKLNNEIFDELRMRGFNDETIFAIRNDVLENQEGNQRNIFADSKLDALGFPEQVAQVQNPKQRIDNIEQRLRVEVDPNKRAELVRAQMEAEAVNFDRVVFKGDKAIGAFWFVDIDNDYRDPIAMQKFLDMAKDMGVNDNHVMIIPDNQAAQPFALFANERGVAVRRVRKGEDFGKDVLKKARKNDKDGPWQYAALRNDPNRLGDKKQNIKRIFDDPDFGGDDLEAIYIHPGFKNSDTDWDNGRAQALKGTGARKAAGATPVASGALEIYRSDVPATEWQGVINANVLGGIELGSGYSNVEIDPKVAADGPDGNFRQDRNGPFPHAIKRNTPAADHLNNGGTIADAPSEGLFDYIFQQTGWRSDGYGINPGEEGIGPWAGHGGVPAYAVTDPSRFVLNTDGPEGISQIKFLTELDSEGNVVAWKVFKASTGAFKFDIENEVIMAKLMRSAGFTHYPVTEFARNKNHKGPRWHAMDNTMAASFGLDPSEFLQPDGSWKPGYSQIAGGDASRAQLRKLGKEDRDSYALLLMIDLLTGNTDRHDGNWSIVTTPEGGVRLAIYDVGASFKERSGARRGEDHVLQHDGYRHTRRLWSLFDDDTTQVKESISKIFDQMQTMDFEGIFAEMREGASPKLLAYLNDIEEGMKKSLSKDARYYMRLLDGYR